MMYKLPEVLEAVSKARRKVKGFSLQNSLCSIGTDLNNSLIEIISLLPFHYSQEFIALQRDDKFNLQEYINSLISGEIVLENEIKLEGYNMCQEKLVLMHDSLKKQIAKTEEKIK